MRAMKILALATCCSCLPLAASADATQELCTEIKTLLQGEAEFIKLHGEKIGENQWKLPAGSAMHDDCVVTQDNHQHELACTYAQSDAAAADAWMAELTDEIQRCVGEIRGFQYYAESTPDNKLWDKESEDSISHIFIWTSKDGTALQSNFTVRYKAQ